MAHWARFEGADAGVIYLNSDAVWERVIAGLHCERVLQSKSSTADPDTDMCADCYTTFMQRERAEVAKFAEVTRLGLNRLLATLSDDSIASFSLRTRWW